MKKTGKIFTLILMTALILASNEAQARQTLNIGLIRFEAIPLDNAVRLEWDTETELGTAGYRLKRGQNGSFSYLQNADGSGSLFIISEGGPSLGANYSTVDETAVNGETYTYQLIELTVDGSETVQAERTVTTGVKPTNTPIVLGDPGGGGGGNQDTPTPEPTATSTSTPAPTNTPVTSPTAVPTIAATSTPLATVTQISQAASVPISSPNNAQTAIPTTSTQEPSDSSANPGIPLAQALEEPLTNETLDSTWIGSEQSSQEGSAGLKIEQDENITLIDTSNNNNKPVVIGNNRSHTIQQVPVSTERNQEPITTTNLWAGRIYLWVAFIAAIVIFFAAVLGAILLYTRRRNKE